MQKVLAKLQKLGKALMLPIACLPVAGILMGIGYMIDSNVMSGLGDPNVIAFFLVKVGGAIIDNMPILFAIGVAIGLSDDHEGTSALAGLVSWLMVQQILQIFLCHLSLPLFFLLKNQLLLYLQHLMFLFVQALLQLHLLIYQVLLLSLLLLLVY